MQPNNPTTTLPTSLPERWVPGGIKNYFLSVSELVNLLEPLVIALGWTGDYRQLVEALPHFSEGLSLTAFLNVMASINYNSEHIEGNLNKIPLDFLPCIFIPKDGIAAKVPVLPLGITRS